MASLLNLFCEILLIAVFVKCEFNQQPKIHAKNGNLILETVRDKNVTFRLSPNSGLYINETNLLDGIKDNLIPAKTEEALPNVDLITLEIKSLKRDVNRLRLRVQSLQMQNRTNGRLLMNRVTRFTARLDLIDKNLNTNECESQDGGSPCKNGGTCYKMYKGFHCECMDGWTGKTCEDDVDECYILTGTDLGCQNNAICSNTPGGYTCKCRKGFSGTHCRLRSSACDTAQSTELCEHGTCINANNEIGYTCICDSGWKKNNATSTCNVDVNECDESTNPCHSECINLPGSFKCGACPTGYTGNGRICLDVNECETNNGGCSQSPMVKCINSEGSYRCGTCPTGWEGDGIVCQQAKSNICKMENICFPAAKCEYISDNVVCTCPLGMFGHGFGANGCSGNITTDPCSNHVCKNNGTCTVMGHGTSCICQAGFTGPQCENGDACNPNPCQNGGTCVLRRNNKYMCTCAVGVTGTNCDIVRSSCGRIYNAESGELSYPPDGRSYEVNERCAWAIRTSPTKIINVTFSEFDVESEPDCESDWLQIHDGRSLASHLIGRFCGKSLPNGNGIILSSQRFLFFWFRSDNATNGKGLKFSWTSQEHTCGGKLSLEEKDNGFLRSPGYPGKTSINRECVWELNAPYGYRLVLRFYEVNLGGDQNCTKDTLKVYDSNVLLLPICESTHPEPLHTSSNIVMVHFHTDAFGTDSSFQLHYEVVPGAPHCGGIFTEPIGVFSGYINADVCLYLIQQPKGTKVKLEFTKLELLSCGLQSVEVFDGKSDEDTLLQELCGEQTNVEPIISSGNFLLIRYKYLLNGLNLQKQFEAKYSRVCDETFIGPEGGFEGGILTTPNYPNPYFDHITCTYYIMGPIDTVVHLNFTDFSISESTPVDAMNDDFNMTAINAQSKNFVEVNLGSSTRRYYKGAPMHLVSDRNRLSIIFSATANTKKARGIRVEYWFEAIRCGGVFIDEQGSFSKEGLVSHSPVFCEWIIEAPEGKHIRLKLDYKCFGAKCDRNEKDVIIYGNKTKDSSESYDLQCNEECSIDQSFYTNILTVIFSKAPVPQPGIFTFDISANYSLSNYDLECGESSNARFGIIKTPNWPSAYPESVICTWVITAPLGHTIELNIQNFSLETTGFECKYDDFLEIRNGKSRDSPLIGRYCGEVIPTRIPSFGNHLYIRFVSDGYITANGFYMTWEHTETGCVGKLISHIGSIHSPHNYGSNEGSATCDWKIIVAQGSVLDLVLTRLSDNEDICNQNALKIYDGPTVASSVIKLNCSSDDDKINLRSTTNQVVVRYTADDINKDSLQFSLDYQTNCKVDINALQGVIESPNFPDNYPSNIICEWNIRGSKNSKITLQFSHLQVENRVTCDYDYVEITDFKGDTPLSKRRFCEMPREAILSEGNRMLLKFESDSSVSKQGFRLEYKRIGCGQHFRSEHGNIETPNAPYSVDMECEWYIEVPAGKQIMLTFSKIHFEPEQYNCNNDVLIVSESPKDTNKLYRSCRIEQTSVTLTSPANRMYIAFKSSDTRSRKFFIATYYTRDAKCGGVISGSTGSLATPNYPDGYVTNAECVWNINVENSYGITLFWFDFNATETENCSSTYAELTMLNGTQQQLFRRFCGDHRQTDSISGNQVTLTLKASNDGWARFALIYIKRCGGELTSPTGFLKSYVGESCEWTINSSEGSHISLDILHVECPCLNKDKCPISIVKIENSETTSPLKKNLCEDHQMNINLPLNKLSILTSNVNFHAKYSSIQSSCGGTLTSMQGILTSPYFPSTYPSNVECIWNIQGVRGSFIVINFEALDIKPSEHCNEDFLEIRSSEQGDILGLYCSKELPMNNVISYEKMWIKFRSSEGSTAFGFKLLWNYEHHNELNGTRGVIESPPVAAAQNDQEPFSWRILVERNQVVSLNFVEYNEGLQLYDGFDQTALQVEISYSPWRFISSSNVIFIMTVIDEIEHFKIEWTAIEKDTINVNGTVKKCHEEIILAPGIYVNLSSPGYPHGYDHNLDCEWIIKSADIYQHVVLALFEVKLEDMVDCFADTLRIYTSSNLQDWREVLEICKSKDTGLLPFMRVHGTPYIKVELKTDASINGTGFTSLLTTVCGSNLTNSVGSILENDLTTRVQSDICIWYISIRPGKRLELQFEYGSNLIDEKEKCNGYAIVYDGLDEDAPILPPGQICNQKGKNVKLLNSTSNHIVVKYNLLNIARGGQLWNLSYHEIGDCEDEFVLTDVQRSINITTPNYPDVPPHPHMECNWIVVGPPGETLQAEFDNHFDLNTRFCNQEYVELFDGSTEMAHSLGKFCRKPSPIRTTGNILYIHYASDVAEPRSGFQVNVSVAICGGTYTLGYGTITSNNYPIPGAYPKFTTCEYSVKVPSHSRVSLNFTDIHLPFDPQNITKSDYIEIQSIDPNPFHITTLYGNISEKYYLETDFNEVLIRFRTFQGDKTNSHRGFKVIYRRTYGACYQDLSGDSGILTLTKTRSYLSPCRWKVTVPKGKRVRLEFWNIPGQSISDTRESNFRRLSRATRFEFFNDGAFLSKITEFDLANYNSSIVIKSTDNFLQARITVGNDLPIHSQIRARFYSDEESPCPPGIEGMVSGAIQIGTLLSMNSFYCKLNFETNGDETIVFKIQELIVHRNTSNSFWPYALLFRDNQISGRIRSWSTNASNTLVSISSKSGSVTFLHNRNIRILSLSITFRRHACGGVVTLSNGFTLSYPVMIDLGGEPVECVWLLKADNEPYKINGSSSFSDTCEREYITFNAGMTSDSSQLAKFCKDSPLPNEVSMSRRFVTMVYHTENYKFMQSNFSFSVRKTITCGNKMHIWRTSLPIQINADQYHNNMECSWEFEANEGFYLSVNFIGRFFIEDSINCIKDYLEVQSYKHGLWIPQTRFCGRLVPASFNISSNHIKLVFRTNDAINGDGFTFTTSAGCTVSFNVTTTLQTMSTPRRSSYISKVECDYEFFSNTSDLIKVWLEDKGFEGNSLRRFYQNTEDCVFTSFTMYKKTENGITKQPGAFCKTGDTFRAYNYLKLHFSGLAANFFKINFELNTCGGNISSPSTISSLVHEEGNFYAPNMKCIWYLTAPADQSIVVRFKYFEMEAGRNCSYDAVAIYSGSTMTDENRVALLCGNKTADPPIIVVSGHRAVISAISDGSNEKKGFLADIVFVSNCNERILLAEGNSPIALVRHFKLNSTEEELFCYYRIMAPEGYRVQVHLKSVELNGTLCERNIFEILDSIGAKQLSLGKYCSSSRAYVKFLTSYEDGTFKLSAKNVGQYSFEIVLNMVPSVCGERHELEVTPDTNIQIQHPINATLYAPNTHCTYRIVSKEEFQIEFISGHLQNISEVTGKCVDFIHVKGHFGSQYFCGEFSGFTINMRRVRSAYAEITFHSDESIEGKGFVLLASPLHRCNRIYTKLSDQIMFNNLETNREVNNCIEEIRVPENYKLTFYIVNLYFDGYGECAQSKFKIVDLNNNRTLMERCRNVYTRDASLFTETNAVRIFANSFHLIRLFYIANYRNMSEGCGGDIYATVGEFSNPPYDNRNYSSCRWDIRVPAPNKIKISFIEFDMGVESNCQLDYVDILEVQPNESEILGSHFCGQKTPETYTSVNSHIVFIAKKTPNFDGTGWLINFETVVDESIDTHQFNDMF